MKETEKEAPKPASKPPQKSADSSDDDFVSDDDEGMIFEIITRVITYNSRSISRSGHGFHDSTQESVGNANDLA